MDAHGLDGLVAARTLNVRYATNFDGITMRAWEWRSFAILPRDPAAPPTLIVTGLEVPRLVRYPTWVPQILVYGAQPSPEVSISRWAAPESPADMTDMERAWEELEDDVETVGSTAFQALKVGLESTSLAQARVGFDDLRVASYLAGMGLSQLQPFEATNIFREIRMVKTAPEVELMSIAAKMNEEAGVKAIHTVRPGQAWVEVENAWAAELCAHGGRPVYFSCGTSEGRFPSLTAGETITFDGLGSYRGYHADIGRTAVMGEPRPDQLAKYNALRQGFHQIYPLLKPGMTSSDISKQVLAIAREAGLPKYSIATPHCVGLEHTDHPVPMGSEPPGTHLPWTLETGMTFNIDMPYLERGWGKLHLEDTLLATEDGVRPLTSMKTELISVKI